MNPLVRTIAWLAGLVASAAVLLALGEWMATPPLVDLAALPSWLERNDPALAAFAILRIAALVVVGYLLLSTLVLLAAERSRVPALATAARRFAAPVARRAVRGACGAGLAATIASSTSTAFALGPASMHHATAVAPAVPHLRWSPDVDVADRADEPTSPAPAIAPPTSVGSPVPTSGTSPRIASPPPTTTASTPAPVLHDLGDELVLVHLGPTSDEAAPAPTSDPPTGPPGTPAPNATAHPSEPAPTAPTPTSAPSSPPPGDRPSPSSDAGGADEATPAGGDRGTGGTGEATPPGTTETRPDRDVPRPEPPGAGSEAGDPGTADGHHTVVTGDHLWGIAERTLAAAWLAPPQPHEVATYLQGLIAANRSVLAVADDPDLIFPGQVFVLPAVPAR